MFFKKPHQHTWEGVGYHSGKWRSLPDNPYAKSAHIYKFYYCASCNKFKVSFGWNEIIGILPKETKEDEYPRDAAYRYIKKIVEEIRDDFLSKDYDANYQI